MSNVIVLTIFIQMIIYGNFETCNPVLRSCDLFHWCDNQAHSMPISHALVFSGFLPFSPWASGAFWGYEVGYAGDVEPTCIPVAIHRRSTGLYSPSFHLGSKLAARNSAPTRLAVRTKMAASRTRPTIWPFGGQGRLPREPPFDDTLDCDGEASTRAGAPGPSTSLKR